MTRNRSVLVRMLSVAVAVALSVCLVPGSASAIAGRVTSRVSVSSAGAEGTGSSWDAALSSNGRYVAFESDSENLVLGDTNSASDIFVRDRQTNTTERVSVGHLGQATGGGSYAPSISADGRYVTFTSDATNLVVNDTNSARDVFVRDRLLGVTTRVSVSVSGAQSTYDSESPCISPDGRYVAFWSFDSDLVVGDSNGVGDILVRDLLLKTTERVSVGFGGQGDLAAGNDPVISAGGRYVAFSSDATNLLSEADGNGVRDVFVRDRLLGATTRVSVKTGGVAGDGDSQAPSISANGRYVAYSSAATNLVDGDTNLKQDCFVRDRDMATTERVSMGSAGQQATGGDCVNPSISDDGTMVAFGSDATNLVTVDANGGFDVFVRNRSAASTARVSVSSTGAEGNGYSWTPCISGDGRYAAFTSFASNLVSGDNNGHTDIFVHDPYVAATSATIKTTSAKVRIGNAPILSGRVTPAALTGWNMVVYVKKPGKKNWSYSSNRTVYALGGNGAWYYKYTFKKGMKKGVYYFKANVPALPGFATSMSPTITIRLR
jgi:Tol biopolymer transport system component